MELRQLVELVFRLWKEEIPQEEFEKKIKHGPSLDGLVSLLNKVETNRNAVDLEVVMYVGFYFKLFSPKCVEVLDRIFHCEWHNRHEDIVEALSRELQNEIESEKIIRKYFSEMMSQRLEDVNIELVSKIAGIVFWIDNVFFYSVLNTTMNSNFQLGHEIKSRILQEG